MNSRQRRAFLAASLGLAMLALCAGTVSAADWVHEAVDPGASARRGATLDVGPNGTAHIAYSTGTANADYAVRENGAWSLKNSAGGLGFDFALDQAGTPHMLISNGSTVSLATRTPFNTWFSVPVATGTVSQTVALAFDSQNRPHVGYGDTSTNSLKHAVRNGVSWTATTAATNSRFGTANPIFDLAVNPSDQPSFMWSSTGAAQLSQFDGSTWQGNFIAPNTVSGKLTFDSSGILHTTYLRNDLPRGVYYGAYDGTGWTTSPIDSLGDITGGIAIDRYGRPHTTYFDTAQTSGGFDLLRHAYWDGTAWQNEILASWLNTSSGRETTDMAIDAAGNLHVAYVDDSGQLYYAFLAVPEPSTWALAACGLTLLGVFGWTKRRRRAG